MRGTLWSIVIAGVGVMTVVVGATEALPANPSSSTSGVADALSALAPFAGQLLLLAVVGALLAWTMDI